MPQHPHVKTTQYADIGVIYPFTCCIHSSNIRICKSPPSAERNESCLPRRSCFALATSPSPAPRVPPALRRGSCSPHFHRPPLRTPSQSPFGLGLALRS